VHELKHDGYRLQIHVRDGRVRLYTRNGADWTKRYPRIVEEAARLREPLIIDAEVVCLSDKGVADFDILHSRIADERAIALAFDLLLSGDDIRRQPLIERKNALRWGLRKAREGIQYVEDTDGDGHKMFDAVCQLGLRRDCEQAPKFGLSIGAVKDLAENPKSKGSGATRVRRNILKLQIVEWMPVAGHPVPQAASRSHVLQPICRRPARSSLAWKGG
jgi:ATP dependent DNA ligase domain